MKKTIILIISLFLVMMSFTSCLTMLSAVLSDYDDTTSEPEITSSDSEKLSTNTETYTETSKDLKTVNIHVDVSRNLIFSRYDVDVFLGSDKQGTVEHGKSGDFVLKIKTGSYYLFFKSVKESDPVSASMKITVDCDCDVYYKVNCESSRLIVTPYKYDIKRDLYDDEIRIDFNESDLKGSDISDVISKLENIGFTNITKSSKFDVDSESSLYHKVISVKINNYDNYADGLILKKSDKIDIVYHEKKPEQTTSSTTSPDDTKSSGDIRISYHSSHSREIAKQGNSGIYAYRSRGGSYYIYYVINFENGYVYRFRDDEDTCMAAKIVSGDLNSYVLLRYKDSSGIWENALCFKYKTLPDTLILQDHNGFKTELYTEDVNDAVKLLKTKKIYDYSAN